MAMSASRRRKSLSALEAITSMAIPGAFWRMARTSGGSKQVATMSLADTVTTPSTA